ncbi:hypothetical protein ACLB1Q_15010 [Escherichia coli]
MTGRPARRVVLSPRELIYQQSDFARLDSRPRRCWSVVGVGTGAWAIILVPFNFAPMRKSMISAPVFRGFRKVMPPMSRTEKEAIDAGTTWWEADLFQGKPDWKKLQNHPQPR